MARDRLPELRLPGAWPVVCIARFECVLSRRDDVARRVEVRLADLQMHHRAALGFQCPRPDEHLESRLLPNMVHPLRGPNTHRRNYIRVGGAAPPAASRCSARASLRTPSRGEPPRPAVRALN